MVNKITFCPVDINQKQTRATRKKVEDTAIRQDIATGLERCWKKCSEDTISHLSVEMGFSRTYLNNLLKHSKGAIQQEVIQKIQECYAQKLSLSVCQEQLPNLFKGYQSKVTMNNNLSQPPPQVTEVKTRRIAQKDLEAANPCYSQFTLDNDERRKAARDNPKRKERKKMTPSRRKDICKGCDLLVKKYGPLSNTAIGRKMDKIDYRILESIRAEPAPKSVIIHLSDKQGIKYSSQTYPSNKRPIKTISKIDFKKMKKCFKKELTLEVCQKELPTLFPSPLSSSNSTSPVTTATTTSQPPLDNLNQVPYQTTSNPLYSLSLEEALSNDYNEAGDNNDSNSMEESSNNAYDLPSFLQRTLGGYDQKPQQETALSQQQHPVDSELSPLIPAADDDEGFFVQNAPHPETNDDELPDNSSYYKPSNFLKKTLGL